MTVSTEQKTTNKHTGLKIVVVVLGVLLIFGFIGMIATVVYQVTHGKKHPEPAVGEQPGESLPVFGDVTVPIHQGERIARIQSSGNRLIVELATVEGNSRLVILDKTTGHVLGTISFPQQP